MADIFFPTNFIDEQFYYLEKNKIKCFLFLKLYLHFGCNKTITFASSTVNINKQYMSCTLESVIECGVGYYNSPMESLHSSNKDTKFVL